MKFNTFENINNVCVFLSHMCFLSFDIFQKTKLISSSKKSRVYFETELTFRTWQSRAQRSAAIRTLYEHSSDIGSVYGQCVIQNMVKCVVMQILITMARSQVDPCYERSHPINLIAWLWSASIHQLINEIFCLLKILFQQLQMSLVCDINAMSRLVPSLFLSLTLSRCPPTQWIKCPLAYLSPITNIHLNIASNSIQCIQHLRRMSTPRYLLGLWPSEPFAGNWRSVNMWSGASHGHIVLISIFTSIPRQ